MKWYEYNLKDRYTKVYNQHSLEDFWNWWTDDKEDYMEVRVKNWEQVKDYSDKFHVPHASCGMFVNEAWQLKKVVNYFVDKRDDIWFAINPKRRLPNKFGKMVFSSKDINVSKLKYLFIDIDRVVKDGPATNEDLMNADFLANKIIDGFEEAGFNKNYCKICSGNGLQILFKLDVPFELPVPKLNEDTGMYVEDSMFLEIKNVIKEGIGKVLPALSEKFKVDYNVEIDKVCFNVGRIGALPHTYNQKYDEPIPRGIVELVNDGRNEGFSDWLKSIQESKTERAQTSKQYKNIKPLQLSEEYKMIHNSLQQNRIIDLMLKYKFPEGGINNTLWYAVKILMHNSGINTTHKDFISVHNMLMQKHGRSFSTNGLEAQYTGNYNGPINKESINFVAPMVNKYLRLHKATNPSTGASGYCKPVFSISPRGKHRLDITIDTSPRAIKSKPTKQFVLDEIKEDPIKDVSKLQDELYKIRRGDTMDEAHVLNDYKFTPVGVILVKQELAETFSAFMHAFKNKWGMEIAVYMLRYYIPQYANYKRW
jgi:hypothetical protein